jgi:hypothetical protein
MTNPTPKQDLEWLLSGGTREEGIRQVEFEIRHCTERIRRLQLKLANAQHCLKELKAENWPVDHEGLLTLSEDNPLR